MRSNGIPAALAPGLALLGVAAASMVHVTSYAGTLTTFNLTVAGDVAAQSTLQSLSASTECGVQPSWLTLVGNTLYCVDENWNGPNGTLASFEVSADGTLALLDKVDTVGGPVSAVVYGDGGGGLAIAG